MHIITDVSDLGYAAPSLHPKPKSSRGIVEKNRETTVQGLGSRVYRGRISDRAAPNYGLLTPQPEAKNIQLEGGY